MRAGTTRDAAPGGDLGKTIASRTYTANVQISGAGLRAPSPRSAFDGASTPDLDLYVTQICEAAEAGDCEKLSRLLKGARPAPGPGHPQPRAARPPELCASALTTPLPTPSPPSHPPGPGLRLINELGRGTGRTALHEAVAGGHAQAVNLLLLSGASPNVGHPDQGPPLLAAVAAGNVVVVTALLQNGASVAAVDSRRYTALHEACERGSRKMAHLLLQAGASVRAKTALGLTPWQLAASDRVRSLFDRDIGGGGPESPSAPSPAGPPPPWENLAPTVQGLAPPGQAQGQGQGRLQPQPPATQQGARRSPR